MLRMQILEIFWWDRQEAGCIRGLLGTQYPGTATALMYPVYPPPPPAHCGAMSWFLGDATEIQIAMARIKCICMFMCVYVYKYVCICICICIRSLLCLASSLGTSVPTLWCRQHSLTPLPYSLHAPQYIHTRHLDILSVTRVVGIVQVSRYH